MGRKPNPLILEYFERGPKLNDNSNRYPHTCRVCGENFPKGRIDTLTAHITKRCPAISDSERMRACLELHGIGGIGHAKSVAERHNMLARGQGSTAPPSSVLPPEWSALETLAEASRQVDLSENNRSPGSHAGPSHPAIGSAQSVDRFDLQGHHILGTPPTGYEEEAHQYSRPDDGTTAMEGAPAAMPTSPLPARLTPEERLQALLPAAEPSPSSLSISVAAAAAARLRAAFLDPQQLVHHSQSPVSSPPPGEAHAVSSPASQSPPTNTAPAVTETTYLSQPWGQMAYMTTMASCAPNVQNAPPVAAPSLLTRGGVRMDTSGAANVNGRLRHFRSKFTPARRQEVKEVRKLGACIRCRILRKLCSKGTPCDTCRKVLAPRVWMTGCVRSRLHEQLELYSAGVQVVLSQNRINLHRDQLQLTDVNSVVDVSHFPTSEKHIRLATLAVLLEPEEAENTDETKAYHVIMINQDKEDVPAKIEAYMRDVLGQFIDGEPSNFMRVSLRTALRLLEEDKDDLLRKAVELWGLVESIDRERQWTIVERPPGEGKRPQSIKEVENENDVDIYTMICMQLNAAAERKANSTSKSLLSLMDRLLADSKTKAGFKIYLTAVIFLNCVEKSTWAFKAWEQDRLRPGWPLQREPGSFTQQGGNLANMLKMLLGIRHALPATARGDDGKLITMDTDPGIVSYFQSLDLEYDTVEARQKGSQFSPADSRSLDLMFCSYLLLPNTT